MSSTSKEVCEVWNGREVVICMGVAPIVEFICLLKYFDEDDPLAENEAGPEIIVLRLEQAIEEGYIKDLGKMGASFCIAATDKLPEADHIAKILTSNQPRQTRRLQSLSQNLGRIFTAKDSELRGFAAFGAVLQLGVLLYSGLATYHRALSFQKDGRPIEEYAYPCTAVGTLVLVAGMFLCSWVVESSTDEKRYEAIGDWQTRIVWLQQTKTVSDQVFKSCMVYAKDDQKTITTSRRAQKKKKTGSKTTDPSARLSHNDDPSAALQLKKKFRAIAAFGGSVLQSVGLRSNTDSKNKNADAHLAGNDDPSAALQLKTMVGAIVALGGFVLQFVGLRGMHWSASVAQLGAVIVMVGVKAWVRRGLATSPAYEPLTSGFELDSFAKTLGDIQREPWSGDPETPDKGVKSSKNQIPSVSTKSSNEWIVVTGGESSLERPRPRRSLSSQTGIISDAQKVLDARMQLARLAGWRGLASSEAISLATAIECTMDTLDKHRCLPNSGSFTWDFEARYVRSQPRPISIELSDAGSWKIDAAEIEAIISLWLSSVDDEGSEPEDPPGPGRGVDQDDEWLRRGETTSKLGLWIVGEQTPSLARDLQWWIPSDVQLFGLQAKMIGPRLGPFRRRIVRHSQRNEGHGEVRWDPSSLNTMDNFFEDDDNSEDGDNNTEDLGVNRVVKNYNNPADDPCPSDEASDDNKKDGVAKRENRTLICSGASSSVGSLYAMDLYSQFIRAMVKVMTIPFPGEAEEIQPNDNTDDTSWKTFALRNSRLSKLIQDVHNTGLGDLDMIHVSIITPLSAANRLPGVRAVVNLALRHSKQNELSQRWQQAGEDLIWLSRLATRTFPKRSDIVATATANLTEYLRLMNLILELKPARVSESSRSFHIETEDLVKLISDLQRELKHADPAQQEALSKTYEILGRDPDTSQAYKEALRLTAENSDPKEDERDPLYRTGTHYAAITISMTDLEKILEKQHEINAQDLFGRTALHYTCFSRRGSLEAIHLLLEYGADLDIRARHGATPLHYAAMTGDREKVMALVEAGTKIDTPDLSGGSPLYTAAFYGHRDVVVYLWEKANKDLRDRSGWNALHLAAMSGHEEVVKTLVEAGTDREAKDREGRSPLHLAAMAGKEAVAKSFVKAGADREAKDRKGRSPLHLAAMAGKEAAAKSLVEAGADQEAKDHE
jgi:ankyrin repeat protein